MIGEGLQIQREHHIILTKYVQSGAPDGLFGKLFLIRDANNFDKNQNGICFK